MRKLIALSLTLLTIGIGLVYANPPGTFQPLLLNITPPIIPDTWNPLDKNAGTTLSGGDLTSSATGLELTQARTTTSHNTGKYYFEILFTNVGSASVTMAGICNSTQSLSAAPGISVNAYTYYGNNGNKFFNSGSGIAYGLSLANNDVNGVAVDFDNGNIWWHKNGTYPASGNPSTGANPAFTGIAGSWFPCTGIYSGSSRTVTSTANFGATTFTYSVPTGFTAGWSK